MKYLKLFESIDEIQKEVESLSYIMEDEGIEVKIYKTTILSMYGSEFNIDFIIPGTSVDSQYGIDEKIPYAKVKKLYRDLKKSQEFLEYFSRLKEICNKHNLFINKNFGNHWCMLRIDKIPPSQKFKVFKPQNEVTKSRRKYPKKF